MVDEKYQEEFELIPMSPIRRLEKRMEQIESTGGTNTGSFLREIVDMVRINQQLVDEIAKANDALRIEISRLPARLEEVSSNLTELINYIKASVTEETGGGQNLISLTPLTEKLDQLIDQNKKIVESNQALATAMTEIGEKLRKPMIQQPIRRPVLIQKPFPTQ